MYNMYRYDLKVRKWEKNLHQVFDETDVDKLCKSGEVYLQKYFDSLPRSGKFSSHLIDVSFPLVSTFLYVTI